MKSSLLYRIDRIQAQPDLKDVLRTMAHEIERSRDEAVTKTDFSELKEIVRDLAEAQKRTEQRMDELAIAQKEMAAAQTEMTHEVTKLSQAMEQTQVQINSLTRGQENIRTQVGGLARTMAYALENEAYIKLPVYLKKHHNIDITDKLIRTEIDGTEINFFAHARQDDVAMLLVGETVLKLDDRSKLAQLQEHVALVKQMFDLPVIPMIVTHFARPPLLAKIEQEGILVIQTFEWE